MFILHGCKNLTGPQTSAIDGTWHEHFMWKRNFADLNHPQGKPTTSTLSLMAGRFSVHISPFDSSYVQFPSPDSSIADTAYIDSIYIYPFPNSNGSYGVESDSVYSGSYSVTKDKITFNIARYNKQRSYTYLVSGDSLLIGVLPGDLTIGEFLWANSAYKVVGVFKRD